MANVVDEVVDVSGEIETVDLQIDKQESTPEKVEAAETPPETKPELPEKYKGKSMEEVWKSYEEAEKKSSRLANEVHEVRQLADELLKSQLARKAEVEKPQEIDFFENPQEAIKRAVESNPRLLQAEKDSLQYKQELSRTKLLAKHPDAMNVVQEPEFIDWIKASKVRTKLFTEADQNYDFDSGDELFSTYKQLKAVKTVPRETAPVSEVEKEARKQTVKSAGVDTSGTSESSRKVYRRADLMRLMQRDPARYDAMSDEILDAYRTGRVR